MRSLRGILSSPCPGWVQQSPSSSVTPAKAALCQRSVCVCAPQDSGDTAHVPRLRVLPWQLCPRTGQGGHSPFLCIPHTNAAHCSALARWQCTFAGCKQRGFSLGTGKYCRHWWPNLSRCLHELQWGLRALGAERGWHWTPKATHPQLYLHPGNQERSSFSASPPAHTNTRDSLKTREESWGAAFVAQ